MKLMVMRRVVELRTEKQRPNLKSMLIGGLYRMTAKERQAKRKQFLHVYEHIEMQERVKAQRESEEQIIERHQEEGEDFRKDRANYTYHHLKAKLRKSIADLDKQANMLKLIQDSVSEQLAIEGVIDKV